MYRFIYFTVALLAAGASCALAQTRLVWGIQSGTGQQEYVMNHVTGSDGSIYVSGTTSGEMEGKGYGGADGFITRLDSSGRVIWTRQFGTPETEDIQWSAIDNSGNVYITGSTTGNLQGLNQGAEDVFLAKFSPEGKPEWFYQFGTDSTDTGKGVYADGNGYVYLTGFTKGKLGQSSFGQSDGFIMKLDDKGKLLFVRQFGSPDDDWSNAITGDQKGRISVCGTTRGNLAASNKGFIDGFTMTLTEEGKQLGANQFGSEGFDIPMAVQADKSGNLYVGGSTSGNFGGPQTGEGDCFLLKIGKDGTMLWNRQSGTAKNDGIRAIALNEKATDHLLVSGVLNLPPAQAFIRMYTTSGDVLWEKNFDADFRQSDASGKAVTMDASGNIYHSGLTRGSVFSQQQGEGDFYLVRLLLEKKYLNNNK